MDTDKTFNPIIAEGIYVYASGQIQVSAEF